MRGRMGRRASITALLLAGAVVLWVGLTTDVTGIGAAEDAHAQASGFRGGVLSEPLPKPRFTLTDTEGRPYDFVEETDGRLTLLFFGFTHCPDICPVHMANIAAVLQDLPELRREIRVVFVSADPERDTPERLRQWLDAFDRTFIGLRGSVAEVNGVLADLRLPPVVHGEVDGRGGYTVGHAAQILVFTPDGHLRLMYPFGTRQADWARDLPRLAGAGEWSTEDAPALAAAQLKASMGLVPLPVGDGPASLYITLSNRAGAADTLIGGATRIAGAVELHRSTTAGGNMLMEQVSGAAVLPGDSLRLVPGGYHLMLHQLTSPLAVGDTFTVELQFRLSGRLPVKAVVVPYTALERMLGGAAAAAHTEH